MAQVESRMDGGHARPQTGAGNGEIVCSNCQSHNAKDRNSCFVCGFTPLGKSESTESLPEWTLETVRSSTPLGVTVISILCFFLAGVLAVGVFLLPDLTILSLGLGGFYAALGVGLWRLRNWARLTIVILLSLGLVVSGFRLIGGDAIALIDIAINGSIVYYLTRRSVVEAFHQEAASSQHAASDIPSDLEEDVALQNG